MPLKLARLRIEISGIMFIEAVTNRILVRFTYNPQLCTLFLPSISDNPGVIRFSEIAV